MELGASSGLLRNSICDLRREIPLDYCAFLHLLTSLNSGVIKGVSLFLQKCLAIEGVQKDFVES